MRDTRGAKRSSTVGKILSLLDVERSMLKRIGAKRNSVYDEISVNVKR